MRHLLTRSLVSALVLTFSAATISVPAQAQEAGPLQQKVEAALSSDLMTPEEQAREAERQPADVLQFFRLQSDMKVMELLPFGGWYTKVLAQVLDEGGKLYVTQPELGRYSDMMRDTLALPGMEDVSAVDWGNEPGEDSPFVGSGTWDVEPLDMVLTFRNYHNFGEEARMTINESAFDALKSGGYYGIVDHTRRHMEPGSRANGRRADPVLVIKEVQEAGFVLEDYSDVLRRPQDELTLEVGQPEVTGQTDRFTLLFRKP